MKQEIIRHMPPPPTNHSEQAPPPGKGPELPPQSTAPVALYPMPLLVVGTMVNGKPNWVLVGHSGVVGMQHIMISLGKHHYSNQGVLATERLSVNVVDRDLLERADYCGCYSGHDRDKSGVFAYTLGPEGTPLLDGAKVSMECAVDFVYETDGFQCFILRICHTYAEPEILTSRDTVDYTKFKPVLFEIQNWTYLETGAPLGECRKIGNSYQP